METTNPALTSVPKPVNWVLIYTTAISILGGLILVLTIFNLPNDLIGLGIFALMVAIAELGSVELFRTSRNSSVSVSMIVTMAAIVALGPLAGVLIEVVSGVMNTVTMNFLRGGNTNKNKASWLRRSSFNTGMFILSTAAAGQVYLLAGGHAGELLHWTNIIPMVMAATVDTFVNLLLLIIVISLQTHLPMWQIWNEDFRWSVPITVAGVTIGGAALALAYGLFGILGTSVFFLPIFTIGYSFRVYTDNLRGYANKLEQANEEANRNNIELLETLSAVIDAYDIYTFGHSTQVAVYAAALSAKMGLPTAEQQLIFKAALVHDIGKVGIPDTIVGKQGRLTPEEYLIMQRHPIIGAEILGRMQGFKEMIPLVRGHQEKYDGCGYPDGLKGEAIPIGARILTLADSLDAMLSDRTYHQRLDFPQVVEEVQRCSGSHFDPQVIAAFLSLAEEQGSEFFHNSAQTIDREVLLSSLGGDAGVASRFMRRSLVGNR